ncbi:MAG: hypothetical protein FJ171_04400 [Gammaproteobacteria bacterium]|nr:hypothetical protein [Gammaproteobacteria bacterium]
MLLTPGDKLLIAHRRLYEGDLPRLFAGTVVAYESGFVKLAGYTWVREPVRGELRKKTDQRTLEVIGPARIVRGELRKKTDQRTKVFGIASPGLICYELPKALDIERLELTPGPQHQVILSDGAGFTMDLTDRNPALRTGSAA